MGGVDYTDRLRTLYNIDRKSKRWWLRIFWGLLDIIFVNKYVISCDIFDKTDVFEFHRSIALGFGSVALEEINSTNAIKSKEENFIQHQRRPIR